MRYGQICIQNQSSGAVSTTWSAWGHVPPGIKQCFDKTILKMLSTALELYTNSKCDRTIFIAKVRCIVRTKGVPIHVKSKKSNESLNRQ